MKKTLLISVFLLFVLVYPFPIRAEESLALDSSFISRASISVEKASFVVSYFVENDLASRSGPLVFFDLGYSGMFIDRKGDLNILYNGEKMREILCEIPSYLSERISVSPEDDSLVFFVEAKYPLSFLYQIKAKLVEMASSLSINGIGVDQENNCVTIFVPDSSFEFAVVDFLVKTIPNFSMDQVSFQYEGKANTTSYHAYGGTPMMYRTWFFGYIYHNYGTIGYNAYNPQTGQYGIVTNAHVAFAYSQWFNEDHQKIGSYSLLQAGGNVDAAFIPFSPSVTWEPTYNVKYQIGSTTYYTYLSEVAPEEGVIVTGAPTFKIGITTGYTTGTIIDPDFYAEVEGYDPDLCGNEDGILVFDNIIKYSNASESGDSGGPVWVSFGGRGATHYLIGINFAGPTDGSYGLGIKESLIENALGVVPILSP